MPVSSAQTRGNWGIAIILLTLLVKLMMFPLGRKQALMAQRSQELQPYLKQIQEKYKDDKEKQTKETVRALQEARRQSGQRLPSGPDPVADLRGALAGPQHQRGSPARVVPLDPRPRRPGHALPVSRRGPRSWAIGSTCCRSWSSALMLFQTKLFAPPPTTPEAEMQQKTMKYMMVFMAFMFYKVPSGLGIYFITSSLWSIGERLLLPKITHAGPDKQIDDEIDAGKGGSAGPRGKSGPGGNGPAPPKKPPGGFSLFMEKILDEARKDPTYRKVIDQRDGKTKEGKPDSDDRHDRDRGKPRAQAGEEMTKASIKEEPRRSAAFWSR